MLDVFLHYLPNVFKAGSFSESGFVNAARLPGQQAAATVLNSSSSAGTKE